LQSRYPTSPELWQLAQLDWDLRACFDGADVAALDAAAAAADSESTWLTQPGILHPSLVLREMTMNVVSIWRAIDADIEVPEAAPLETPLTIAVWRKGLQPHFKTMDAHESAFLHVLSAGESIASVAANFEGGTHLSDPAVFGTWLREWWDDGFFASCVVPLSTPCRSDPGRESIRTSQTGSRPGPLLRELQTATGYLKN
jgi:hypothetical protein